MNFRVSVGFLYLVTTIVVTEIGLSCLKVAQGIFVVLDEPPFPPKNPQKSSLKFHLKCGENRTHRAYLKRKWGREVCFLIISHKVL